MLREAAPQSSQQEPGQLKVWEDSAWPGPVRSTSLSSCCEASGPAPFLRRRRCGLRAPSFLGLYLWVRVPWHTAPRSPDWGQALMGPEENRHPHRNTGHRTVHVHISSLLVSLGKPLSFSVMGAPTSKGLWRTQIKEGMCTCLSNQKHLTSSLLRSWQEVLCVRRGSRPLIYLLSEKSRRVVSDILPCSGRCYLASSCGTEAQGSETKGSE